MVMMLLSQVHDDSDNARRAAQLVSFCFVFFSYSSFGPRPTAEYWCIFTAWKTQQDWVILGAKLLHSRVTRSGRNTHAVKNLHLLAELFHTALHCNAYNSSSSSSQMVLLQHPGIIAQPVSSGPYCVWARLCWLDVTANGLLASQSAGDGAARRSRSPLPSHTGLWPDSLTAVCTRSAARSIRPPPWWMTCRPWPALLSASVRGCAPLEIPQGIKQYDYR